MIKIYLDHHILVDETAWPRLTSIFERRDVKLLLSTWSIREIVQGRLRREERMGFIQSLAPSFLHDMVILQRRELGAFLSLFYFGSGPALFSPCALSFSSFLMESFALVVAPAYSLLDYVDGLGLVDGDVVDQAKDEHANAMRLALANREAIRRMENQIFSAKIMSLIPARGSDGPLARPDELVEILAFCLRHRQLLNRSSPAIFVEDALSAARLSNPSRRPRDSDTGDLYHGVLGLAYADIFVSNDRWAIACAERAKATVFQSGLKTARLLSTIDSLEMALM